MFSVDSEDEAKRLIALTCPQAINGEYYAPELKAEQTLENLYKFSDRLAGAYERMKGPVPA